MRWHHLAAPALAVTLSALAPALASARSIVRVRPRPVSAATLPKLGTGWKANAQAARGRNGARFSVDCPARGRLGSVWGNGVYTDDSSICSAAQHAGVLAPGVGAAIVIEIRPPEQSYAGTTKNGVTSGSWAAWRGSFVVVSAGPLSSARGSAATSIGWGDDFASLAAGTGPLLVECSAAGSAGSLWGSGLYTDDSSVCTAAVHAGLIDFARGGTVLVEARPGQPSYNASAQHGVQSSSWGVWSGSFVVLSGKAGSNPLQVAGP